MRTLIDALSRIRRSFGAGAVSLGLAIVPAEAVVSINGSSFVETITQVTYNDNGSIVVQNSSTSSNNNAPTPVDLLFIELSQSGGGSVTLDEFNTGVVSAVALNFPETETGFEAYVGPDVIGTTDIAAFQAALQEIYSNTSLRDYVNKAQNANANNPDGDYDIFYQFALSNDDYIVVAERDGNSEISLRALDAFGSVIAGSETLVFQGGGNSAYTWDTGYRSALDDNTSDQTLELSVVDISLFGTSEDIFGLRVVNDSGADNKLFIASDDSFSNNAPNPVVPEPSAAGLLAALAALLHVALSRRSAHRGRAAA